MTTHEILLTEHTYRDATSRVDNIPELVKALHQWYLAYPSHNYLHPCVIEGKASLVCLRDLSLINQQAYAKLQEIAKQYRLFLKEDKRTQDVNLGFINRRKKISLVLTFCLGLIASSRMVSADELKGQINSGFVTTHLAAPNIMKAKLPSAETILEAYAKKKPDLKIDEQAEINIKNFLMTAYHPESGDPSYIADDIAAMAHYYSKYPDAVQLFNELQNRKVVLKFKSDNWQTQAWGNQYYIDSATIYFDTRIAAQLLDQEGCETNPACDISPADALLHELLHAKLMLVDSQHFIETGGMLPNLYPFEHEREVIAGENRLYQEMNEQDGLSRPIRNRHTGHLFHVNCAACLPTELIAAN